VKQAAKVWALIGHRKGDNSQVLALAEALGVPFEVKHLKYNRLRHLPAPLRRPGLVSLTRQSRKLIRPPWPELVIGVGYRSVPIARFIKRASGGRTRIVQIGNPRRDPGVLDLLITTPQYPQRPGPNVLAVPVPIGARRGRTAPSDEESAWLAKLERPLRLVVVGGPTRGWRIDHDELASAIHTLIARCEGDGGTVVGVASPRTDRASVALLRKLVGGRRYVFAGDFPRYDVLLASADEIYATADSVSMVSEAMLSGRPAGMIPVRETGAGRLIRRLSKRLRGRAPAPDLPAFWDYLERERLIGTVDQPMVSNIPESLPLAVGGVRDLLV
jgi:mitochondrial fission protein ELM1